MLSDCQTHRDMAQGAVYLCECQLFGVGIKVTWFGIVQGSILGPILYAIFLYTLQVFNHNSEKQSKSRKIL